MPPSDADRPESGVVGPMADPLPEGLIAPSDDGLALHLPGRRMPSLSLPCTDGSEVALDAVSEGRWVLYFYPMTGAPGAASPHDWDAIPGARGCSQEACSFRDNLTAVRAAGGARVLGLSSDSQEHQHSLVARYHLPYPMLSDRRLAVADALQLPTFRVDGTVYYKRLTLVVDADRIRHAFYPIFPPDTHAERVVEWLRRHPA